jgi:hypothetical protein
MEIVNSRTVYYDEVRTMCSGILVSFDLWHRMICPKYQRTRFSSVPVGEQLEVAMRKRRAELMVVPELSRRSEPAKGLVYLLVHS